MTNNTSPNPEPQGQTASGTDPQGQTPNPQSQTPSGTPQQTPIDSLPADIQAYIKKLRDEAEEANKQKKAEARAKQEAEAARLKEQGEFKALAEKHETRVKELEPVAERYAQLSHLVATQIDAEIKDWPVEVKTFDPGKDAPIESRLEWRNKSRPLIEKMNAQAQGAVPGMRPNPPAQGQPTREDLVAANMAAMRKDPRYKGVL